MTECIGIWSRIDAMRVTHDLSTLDTQLPYPVLAIGVFDGVHLGHQSILCTLRERAKRFRGTPVLLSFHPHPQKVISPQNAPPLLQTRRQKHEILEAQGVEVLMELGFTRKLSLLSPEEFVEQMLVRHRIREIHVGSNFRFGHRRRGDFALLKALGARHSYEVFETPILEVRHLRVSSTRIRNFLRAGRVSQAGRLLGRCYEIRGTVVQGARRGRQLGFPTANLKSQNELIPAPGVYVTRARVNRGWHCSVTNIGYRPTVESNSALTVETHLLNWDEDLYGKEMAVEFWARIRGERRFPGFDALRSQIARDVAHAKWVFSKVGGGGGG